MVNDIVHYAMILKRYPDGRDCNEVVIFRRLELNGCINRVDSCITI